jgi:hypothetical protein
MKGFIALAHRCCVSGLFLTDRDAKGPIVGINGRCNNMIMPCVMERTKHEASEVAIGEMSGN